MSRTAARDEFQLRGFAGPYRCEAGSLADLPAVAWQTREAAGTAGDTPGDITDPHRDTALVREVIEHPSVTGRVAGLLAEDRFWYFQSRLRIRPAHGADPVVWHQDVGPRNGGCLPDGQPVPTLTMWLSLDGAGPDSGCLLVLPGTHGKPLGNWQEGYRANIGGTGALAHLDPAGAIPLATRPGEFYLLHSWLVHTASPNLSPAPRTALVARFVSSRHAIDTRINYHPCRGGAAPPA
jgi:ectoine hydroxylase-related dioxygenase (phytanoyl-CoA dioxygenase family)